MRDNDVIAYVLPFIYWVVDLPPRIQNWTGLNFQTAAMPWPKRYRYTPRTTPTRPLASERTNAVRPNRVISMWPARFKIATARSGTERRIPGTGARDVLRH